MESSIPADQNLDELYEFVSEQLDNGASENEIRAMWFKRGIGIDSTDEMIRSHTEAKNEQGETAPSGFLSASPSR